MQIKNFVELSSYVARGVKATGSVVELADILGQARSSIRSARKGRRGLPVYACMKLAELINVVPLAIIAASALVTETTAERRSVLLHYVELC